MTSTAPPAPASSSARARAATGSDTASTRSKCGEASAASSAAESARSLRALRCDEHRTGTDEPLEDHRGVLVAEDRATTRSRRAPPGAARAASRCLERVRSVPDLERPRSSSRPGSAIPSARAGRPPGRGTPRPPREGEVAAPGHDPAPASFCSASCAPLRLGQDDGAPGLHDRELLARDRLARVAEHVRVLERRRS